MKIINKKIIILGALLSPFLFFNHITSALSYESSQGISFTLNPSISVTVSGDLTIANLTPGDYKDSNNITVTASSNSIAGYSLSSTVGSSTNTSTELRKDGVDTTNKFSSITTNKASLSNFDDSTNTWGYSYSTDSGSTWISGDITGTTNTGYNGLPLYTSSSSIKLINSTTSGSSSILFKIGARTTTNQIAGEYTNVINFIGVANPNPPIVYMQNATLADCGKDMVDSRDNNVYSTTLLSNGQCWMTKNLDLAGGTRLSSADTDFDSNYTLPTTNGWTVIDDKLVMPASSTSGFNIKGYAYVYNSNSTACGSNSPCYSYYSWDTATLGSGRNNSTGNADAPYSICPKGWHLPNTRSGTDDTSDFRKLVILLGGNAATEIYTADTTPTGATIFNGLSSSPLKFLRAGDYYDSAFSNGGVGGDYWAANGVDGYAYHLRFYSTYVHTANANSNANGFSVRCVKSS